MEYTITETRKRESIDVKFRRSMALLNYSMKLNRPLDEIYRHSRTVFRYAIDYLDMKEYLEQR